MVNFMEKGVSAPPFIKLQCLAKFKTTFEKNVFFYDCVILIYFLHHSTYFSILLCNHGTLVFFKISKCNFICFVLLRETSLSYFCG